MSSFYIYFGGHSKRVQRPDEMLLGIGISPQTAYIRARDRGCDWAQQVLVSGDRDQFHVVGTLNKVDVGDYWAVEWYYSSTTTSKHMENVPKDIPCPWFESKPGRGE